MPDYTKLYAELDAKVKVRIQELNRVHAGAPYNGVIMEFARLTGRTPESIAGQMLYRTGKMSLARELGSEPQHGPWYALLGDANPFKLKEAIK